MAMTIEPSSKKTEQNKTTQNRKQVLAEANWWTQCLSLIFFFNPRREKKRWDGMQDRAETYNKCGIKVNIQKKVHVGQY